MFAHTHHGLGDAELHEESIELLPDRTAMSLINANLALPINVALAANVLSDGAVAVADATENTPIDQGMLQGTPTL